MPSWIIKNLQLQINFFYDQIINHKQMLSGIKMNLLSAQEKIKDDLEETAKYDAMIDLISYKIYLSEDLISHFSILLEYLTKADLTKLYLELQKFISESDRQNPEGIDFMPSLKKLERNVFESLELEEAKA